MNKALNVKKTGRAGEFKFLRLVIYHLPKYSMLSSALSKTSSNFGSVIFSSSFSAFLGFFFFFFEATLVYFNSSA